MTGNQNILQQRRPPTTEADASPPLKMDITVLPLDTSSQASAAETEASMGSNPIGILTMAATHSSWSSSPIVELSKLQSDTHMAVHSTFTAKRSSDLQIQCAIQDYEASLHQLEVETTAANVKAKVVHSRRDLRARVKCAKIMIKAKYDYCMTIQEARAERCTELEESEAAYSKAINENAANHSLKSATLCWEHMEHMQELEMHVLKVENKSCQHFLVAHQAVLHQALLSLKEILHSSYLLLLGPSLSSHQPPYSHPCTWGGRAAALHYFSQTRTQKVSSPKEVTFIHGCPGRHVNGRGFPHKFTGGIVKLQERGGQLIGLPPWGPNVWMPLAGIQILWRRQEPIISQLTPGIGFTVIRKICPTYLRDSPKKLAHWVSLFSKIQWSWKGPEHLRQANYIFQTQPKGLKFLRAVSAKESPKEMGLKGIHDPEALQHFSRFTYCL